MLPTKDAQAILLSTFLIENLTELGLSKNDLAFISTSAAMNIWEVGVPPKYHQH
jgi:hypothetical protein